MKAKIAYLVKGYVYPEDDYEPDWEFLDQNYLDRYSSYSEVKKIVYFEVENEE